MLSCCSQEEKEIFPYNTRIHLHKVERREAEWPKAEWPKAERQKVEWQKVEWPNVERQKVKKYRTPNDRTPNRTKRRKWPEFLHYKKFLKFLIMYNIKKSIIMI